MSFGRLLSSTDISASGLTAERLRMEIAANNIANVHTTSTPEGGPFRRQQVAFQTALNASLGSDAGEDMAGVSVKGIGDDPTELPKIFNPGHPDADADGFVTMPNVKLPMEMVDLMTASRAYDANLKSLTTFRKMAEQSLVLMDIR